MTLYALRNALLRGILFALMALAGPLARAAIRRRVSGQGARQATLRQRYGITPDTPIEGYTEALRERVRASGARIVTTSGSTAQPKELAYPRARTRMVRILFAQVTLRCAAAMRIRRPMIFTLSSLTEDGSLTAVMTRANPSLLDGLVTPDRVLHHPAFSVLVETYGLMAVRLWAMVLSNPGWLYATNPSTLAVFFHSLRTDWPASTAMLSDWVSDPSRFDPAVHRAACRIVAPGWTERARKALATHTPPPRDQWLPALQTFSSWDGGNTRPFLTQVRTHLPDAKFVPMFSMSTEVIETVTVYQDGHPHFLPLGPGILYEFLPAGAEDDPARLLGPDALTVGQSYTMVVSDPWGLRRYQTEDVFSCVAMVEGLPDLRFLRRRGLTWSFTGEKLTGPHLEQSYAALVEAHPVLAGIQLTTAPSHPEGARLPGYRLVLAPAGDPPTIDRDALAAQFDALLRGINDEYDGKRASQRLAAPVAEVVAYDDLAAAIRGQTDVRARDWDSQFKLLPLLQKTWEALDLPDQAPR